MRKTEVPSTKFLEKGAEGSEIPWNKKEEIECDEVISKKVSNSNDIYFTNQRDEASPETPNQVSEEQDKIPTEDHQTLKDVQKSESDEQVSQSNTETESALTVVKQKTDNFPFSKCSWAGFFLVLLDLAPPITFLHPPL